MCYRRGTRHRGFTANKCLVRQTAWIDQENQLEVDQLRLVLHGQAGEYGIFDQAALGECIRLQCQCIVVLGSTGDLDLDQLGIGARISGEMIGKRLVLHGLQRCGLQGGKDWRYYDVILDQGLHAVDAHTQALHVRHETAAQAILSSGNSLLQFCFL